MATIPQMNLFSWKNVDESSDLDRLHFVLNVIPDEELMQVMERARGRGRDDYPVRAVWNSVLAGIVFEHVSIESLRRELKRNGELRDMCGFDPLLGMASVPPASAYSRFFKNLFYNTKYVEKMFDDLVTDLKKELPDFGKHLAVDGKAIESVGKPNKKEADGRRETDADWGVKSYQMEKNGRVWEKVKSWFGFKLHLIVDAQYELPVAFEITRASVPDTRRLIPMMKYLGKTHPGMVRQAEYLDGDKGYDSAENNRLVWDEFGVKPVIDTRRMWKDGELTRPLFPDRTDNIVHDERGGVYCMGPSASHPVDLEKRQMAFCGFEASRNTLKYRCPAAAYGLECPSFRDKSCSKTSYGRIVRVAVSTNRRIFTPLPRHSYKWKRLYAKRGAVERVNSRLDVSFGFERHFIRGLPKMRTRMGMALVVMLAMALGSIRAGQKKRMRSLVRPVPIPKAA